MKNRLKKILISAILAFSVATAPLNVSASDTITDTNSSSRTIVVSYDVDATYTVNIPSSISLTDTAGKTETVICDTLIMSQGKGLAFSIKGANTSDGSANFSVKNEENEASTVTYSITADDVIDVKSNNHIKTFHDNNKNANLNFLITGEQSG